MTGIAHLAFEEYKYIVVAFVIVGVSFVCWGVYVVVWGFVCEEVSTV